MYVSFRPQSEHFYQFNAYFMYPSAHSQNILIYRYKKRDISENDHKNFDFLTVLEE
jgi:hypothetical protein